MVAEMTGTADEFLERLKQSVLTSGFSTSLGVEPLHCWAGECELVVEITPQLTQHHGFAHGAVVGAAADNACAWAAASLAGDVVTSSYTIHLVAPAKGERLRARGQVLRNGRRQLTVRADVFAETGGESRLVATALAAVTKVER